MSLILMAFLLFTQPDSISSNYIFPLAPPIFHHPPKVLFNSRSFDLELFIKTSRDSIKSISFFYQTDEMPRLVEIPFDVNSPRIQFHYDPKLRPAKKITYYFVVSLRDGSLYAAPVDSSGILKPVTKYLLDPEYYFKRRAALR
ncbi:MAG: hypothetical protein V3S48_04145 [Candidatus Neomarinimicrobiota bacterium]